MPSTTKRAGLASAKEMRQVMDYARGNGSRVILSGDRGQHRSVAGGDTLAILEDRAGIRTVELSNIKRQQIAEYREAAHDFGEQRPGAGFDKLDAMGWIHEIDDRQQRIDFRGENLFPISRKPPSPTARQSSPPPMPKSAPSPARSTPPSKNVEKSAKRIFPTNGW